MKFIARASGSRLVIAFVAELVVIAILAAVLWIRIDHAGGSEKLIESPYTAISLAKTKRVNALFVGDDFTAGHGGVGRNAYPRIVCEELRMNCNVDARTGAGLVDPLVATGLIAPQIENDADIFAKGRADSVVLIDRLAIDEKLYAVDVLIVDAGRNDLEAPVPVYQEALVQYLRRADEIWPDAKIFVIAPTYFSPEPIDVYEGRIRAIEAAVAEVGGTLIDPLAEGWYREANTVSLLQPDGVHPNQAGHQFIAGRLKQSLVSRGIGLERQ